MKFAILGFVALVLALVVSRATTKKAFGLLSPEQRQTLRALYRPWRTMLLTVLLSLILLFYEKPHVFVILSVVMMVAYHWAIVRNARRDGFPEGFLSAYLSAKVVFYLGVGVCLASIVVGNKL